MKHFRCWVLAISLPGLLLLTVTVATGATAAAPRQEQIPPPPQALAPHRVIAQLGLEVARLGEQRVLNRGQARSLTVKLDQASDALMVGDPDAVLRPLDAFDHEVGALVGARVVGGKDAIILRGLTGQAIAGVRAVRQLPHVEPAIKPCPAPDPCEALVLHVDARARSGGDGDTDAPYRNIGEALAAAAEAQACSVEIRLHAGTYRESLTLTRATHIDGGPDRPIIVGSLLDPAGYPLRVSRVMFDGSPAPGAIVVDGPCGSLTEVSDVVIRGAHHHGILQRRGALRVIGAQIRGTLPDPSDPNTGRAIRLVDGARAVIGVVNLSFNVGGALLASGENTRVYLALSEASFNELHPLPRAAPSPSGHGAIEIADGALLLSEFTALVGNQGTGILVRKGARAHFRYGRIEHTGHVDIEGEGRVYGLNGLAFDGGTLQLTHFRANHADLAGLYFWRGYGRAAHGLVAYNPIGLAAAELPADFSVNELFACVQDDVRLLHNDRNFDGDVLPLPCSGGTPGDCPVCPVDVPFVCPWCG